jgi:hypothetical protein
MTGREKTNGAFDPVVQPFIEFWSHYAKQANEATRDILDGLDDQTDLKTLQQRWFNAISKSADAYMRSPVFLQAIKHHTAAMVEIKHQADDLTNEVARNLNIPTAADISGLFERLHSVEELILGRLGRIDERLEAIEEKIGSGELAEK